MASNGNIKKKNKNKISGKYKAILSIDCDGTIWENAYPNIGYLRKGAVEYINKLYDEGYGIIINTCRAGLMEADAINFLKRNNIKYHYINCNFPHLVEYFGADCRKISADMYIDDKNILNIPSWKKKYKIINKKFNER